MSPDAALVKAAKAKLLALGYPWPDNLDGKNLSWLEAEIRAMTSEPNPEVAKRPFPGDDEGK
jgi:hypothetical protein